MKELIEKMREAGNKQFECTCNEAYKSRQMADPDCAYCDMFDELIEQCATVAASHYENKWVRVDSGALPMVNVLDISNNIPDEHGNTIYKIIQVTDGVNIWYDGVGDHNVWVYEAKARGATHFRELNFDLPTPPNSDKNVEECDAT